MTTNIFLKYEKFKFSPRIQELICHRVKLSTTKMNIYPLNYYLHPEEESVPRDEIRVLEEEEVGDDGEGGRVRL